MLDREHLVTMIAFRSSDVVRTERVACFKSLEVVPPTWSHGVPFKYLSNQATVRRIASI